MEPRGRKRSRRTTVVTSNPATWPSNQTKAGPRVSLSPVTVNPRLPTPRILYDRGGRKPGEHAMLASVLILLVVSRVFHIDSVADSCLLTIVND